MKAFLTAAFTMIAGTAQAQSLGTEFFAQCISPQSMSQQTQALYAQVKARYPVAECEHKLACIEYDVADFRSAIVLKCLMDSINICAKNSAAEDCAQAVTKMMQEYTQEIATQFPEDRVNSALDGGGLGARSLMRAIDGRSLPSNIECGGPARVSRLAAHGISEETACAVFAAGIEHSKIDSIARLTVSLERSAAN